MGPCIVIIF